MAENTECGEGNLQEIVFECLKRIEMYLNRECIEEMELEEVAEELGKLTPVLTIVFSKWVPEIIYSLYIRRKMSFNDIKKVLAISSRVLSDKLKTLEEVKIVSRIVELKKPLRVYYELTELGRTIALALVPLLTLTKLEQT